MNKDFVNSKKISSFSTFLFSREFRIACVMPLFGITVVGVQQEAARFLRMVWTSIVHRRNLFRLYNWTSFAVAILLFLMNSFFLYTL